MADVTKGIVRGIGITPYSDLPDLCINPMFTEVTISELVKIPEGKPDIEDLLSIAVDVEIVSVRLIDTVKGTSNEGQYLTGHKLAIESKLRQKVKYVADEPSQSVYAAHFENIISSISVVVPTTIDIGTPSVKTSIKTLFKQGRLVVSPYVEDIYGELRNKRTIYKNIILLINVTTVACGKFNVKYYMSNNHSNRLG